MSLLSEPPEIRSDFRSDTVTRPTEAMREAMARAAVGDDVFGDDPSVNRLEAEAAALFGKEAALLCPSGTMANLIAILVHCRPGEEALAETHAHTYRYEQGGAARFGGVTLRGIDGDAAGRFALADLEGAITGGPDASLGVRLHCATTRAILIENTHNFAGGRIQPLALVEAIGALAQARGLKLHMDGARIMNAVAATGISPATWAAPVDTVMCCLSKGLSAPVGSLLIGSRRDIDRGRLVRKALGGGMRQAGVLAEPGRLALTTMVERLGEDHRNAQALASGLAAIEPIACDPASVETNIVFCTLPGGAAAHQALAAALTARGIGCHAVGAHGVRFVCHREVGAADVEAALAATREAVAEAAFASA